MIKLHVVIIWSFTWQTCRYCHGSGWSCGYPEDWKYSIPF